MNDGYPFSIRYNIPMNKLEQYKFLLGETIMLYQLAEHDLRLIASLSVVGDYRSNLEKMKQDFKGLGQIVVFLKEMDKKRSKALFSENDYHVLLNLTRRRNYYCHECALDFVYEPEFTDSDSFLSSYNNLVDDHEYLKDIQERIEEVRILLFKNREHL